MSAIIKVTNTSELNQMATLMTQSGLFKDSQSVAQAAVKILAGDALGLDAFTSMSNLNVISGKVTMSAGLQARFLAASPKYDYTVLEMSDTVCSIKVERRRDNEWILAGVSTFTIEDAVRAKLATKDVWKQYPKNMLFARAMSNAIRMYAPDVFAIGSVYDPDELDNVLDADVVSTTNVLRKATVTPYKTLEEAIQWAIAELDSTEDAIRDLYDNTPPDEKGKKGLNFYAEVMRLSAERKSSQARHAA